MLEHYSRVRMAAKKTALDNLESGLIAPPSTGQERIANAASGTAN
jgi:hypothetical protein